MAPTNSQVMSDQVMYQFLPFYSMKHLISTSVYQKLCLVIDILLGANRKVIVDQFMPLILHHDLTPMHQKYMYVYVWLQCHGLGQNTCYFGPYSTLLSTWVV